jgi:hypothetical protein
MGSPPAHLDLDPDVRRTAAVATFNYTWSLLRREDRTERDDDLMIHAAHTSRFLWEDVGGPVNHARGEWQISRVYAVLGRAEPALFHARRCLEICEANGIGDFDLGFAYEALARASSLAGDAAGADRYAVLARAQAAEVADDDDREVLLDDIATLP